MSDPRKVMAERQIGISPDLTASEHSSERTAEDDHNADMQVSELRPMVEDDSRPPIDQEAKDLALTIANAADDRKGGNITILQTGDVSYLADYFVIVTGFSAVQVRAIANAVEDAVEENCRRLPLRTEGMSEGRWVLKDYGDVIVHIFMPDDRDYYDLEAFWGHATRIEFIPTPLSS
ncbi:MAG: ribosome silencing factor [Phormidesmis sp.]